jgi:uncharacterized protein (DUF58 family)
VALPEPTVRILSPELIGRLGRFRLAGRRRVTGRFAGVHASHRYGSSLDFADYRPYAVGDDPRWVDRHAHARLGKLLVKLFEAEDETALRVVVDLSASMGFGTKATRAREVAAGLAAIGCGGGDRVRVIPAGAHVEAGPWYRGPAALPVIEARLTAAPAAGTADLRAALHRAHREGPRGPVVLVSDLLTEEWTDILAALSAGGGDAVLVHVLGRADVDPQLDGDVRVADVETGEEREVSGHERTLEAYAEALGSWLDDVDLRCGQRGIAVARIIDDASVEDLLTLTLTGIGVVA